MYFFTLLTILLFGFTFAFNSWNVKENPFPRMKRVSKTYSFRSAKANGNVTIADQYAWLENDCETDEEVQRFTIAQQTKWKNICLMNLQKDSGHNLINSNQDTAITRYFHQHCFVQLALDLTKKE